MPVNALAENIFGTIGPALFVPSRVSHTLILSHIATGAILWTVQLIPQLFKSYRTKSTEGLSPWLVYALPPSLPDHPH
jgi:hypothetical protein